MIETHPQPIEGRWREGWALDVHTVSSVFVGYDEFGHERFESQRSPTGDLLYRLKYRGGDEAALGELVEAAAAFYLSWHPGAEVIVPIPASRPRARQPVLLLAGALALELGIRSAPAAVGRVREVPETMSSIAATLYDDGRAADVCALTLTRTRSHR